MVNIPKLGRVRFRWTKGLPVAKHAEKDDRITGARLVKDALGWHIAFRVTTLAPAPAVHTGPAVGIDAGITVPLALSDGNDFHHGPWLTPKEQARLLELERRAAHQKSRRKPGEPTSNRLHHTYDRIAGLRAKAKRRHLDRQRQTTTAIANGYGTVVVEKLTITNMVRSAKGTVDNPGTGGAEGRSQPGHPRRGLGPNHCAAGLQDHSTRRNPAQGPRPRNLPAPPRLPAHHGGQPGVPGRVRVREPRVRLVRQRRYQCRPQRSRCIPGGPRACPGCRKVQSSDVETRQARHRKVGGISFNHEGEHFNTSPSTSSSCSTMMPWTPACACCPSRACTVALLSTSYASGCLIRQPCPCPCPCPCPGPCPSAGPPPSGTVPAPPSSSRPP